MSLDFLRPHWMAGQILLLTPLEVRLKQSIRMLGDSAPFELRALGVYGSHERIQFRGCRADGSYIHSDWVDVGNICDRSSGDEMNTNLAPIAPSTLYTNRDVFGYDTQNVGIDEGTSIVTILQGVKRYETAGASGMYQLSASALAGRRKRYTLAVPVDLPAVISSADQVTSIDVRLPMSAGGGGPAFAIYELSTSGGPANGFSLLVQIRDEQSRSFSGGEINGFVPYLSIFQGGPTSRPGTPCVPMIIPPGQSFKLEWRGGLFGGEVGGPWRIWFAFGGELFYAAS